MSETVLPPVSTAPVLMLLFNRYAVSRRLFEQVRAARPARLYISVDGARDRKVGEKEEVQRVRSLAREVDWPCEVHTRFSEVNLGCRDAVVGGIDWFFEREEQGIILEDDCIPDPSFFGYCTELLERYAPDDRVMMVSGADFSQAAGSAYPYSYYFHKYQLIWGWATWRRAWRRFDPAMTAWRAGGRWAFLRRHCSGWDERLYWWTNFNLVSDPTEKSIWSYQWLHAMWRHHGLCISPAGNLITNVGYGAGATHTASQGETHEMPTRPLAFPLRHPPVAAIREFEEQIRRRVYMVRRRGGAFIAGWPLRTLRKRLTAKNKFR